MRVMVVEDEVFASNQVILGLVKAGHELVRCQPIGASVSPCVGLSSPLSTCPLVEPVDVVVRVHTGRHLTQREYGVICAEEQSAPIVDVGPAGVRLVGGSGSEVLLRKLGIGQGSSP